MQWLRAKSSTLRNCPINSLLLQMKIKRLYHCKDMRDEELTTQRVSKYMKDSSIQKLFHHRLQQIPGKREKVQITINAEIEHTLGNRTEFKDKTYGNQICTNS